MKKKKRFKPRSVRRFSTQSEKATYEYCRLQLIVSFPDLKERLEYLEKIYQEFKDERDWVKT